jgi:hypothetical protein
MMDVKQRSRADLGASNPYGRIKAALVAVELSVYLPLPGEPIRKIGISLSNPLNLLFGKTLPRALWKVFVECPSKASRNGGQICPD